MATLVSMTTLLYSDVHINVVDIFTVVSLYTIMTYEIATGCNLSFLIVINGFISMKRLEECLMITNDTQQNTIRNQKCDSATKNDTPSKTGVISCFKNAFKTIMKHKESSKHFKSTEYSFLHNLDDVTDVSSDDNHDVQPHVTMMQVSAGWLEDEHRCIVRDISLNTQPNQLQMVTGPVGSGKSTLLMAILRETSVKSGKISTQGNIAYISQHPWIFTGTVRENILFGQEFEFKRRSSTSVIFLKTSVIFQKET
jgi:ABC-type multidrug transport system fused ATPase/permease subunit